MTLLKNPTSLDPRQDQDTEELNTSPPQPQTAFQRKFSSFHFPLLTKVEPSFRMTHSDVMCISNSGMIANRDKEKPASKSCQLPYEELYSSRRPAKSTSLLQQKHSHGTRKKLDRQLHDEHRKFMSNLLQERQERLRVETDAAIVIQKYMRGFGARQILFPDRFARTSKTYSEHEIWEILLNAVTRVGVNPTEEMLLGHDQPPGFKGFFVAHSE